MSTRELVAERVKRLSESEAKAVLNYIESAFTTRDTERSVDNLEAACLSANIDSALSQEIAEWQSFPSL